MKHLLNAGFRLFFAGVLIFISIGCVHRQPTIAHIHVGHAITGAHDTPERVGYFVYAEKQAKLAAAAAELATKEGNNLDDVRLAVIAVNEITNLEAPYPLTKAVQEAADHIEFAAKSDDASKNIIDGYLDFEASIEGVLFRGGLIAGFATQIEGAETMDEAMFIAEQVQGLAQSNVYGEDTDGDGLIGTTHREYGVVQIKSALDDLVAREDPPYLTVDRWYLFNLIRLPSGDWVFKRSGGGGTRGY